MGPGQGLNAWSDANGYSIGGGGCKADGHPVHTVNWFDVVKWCNARSQMDGLTPCYYSDAELVNIYKSDDTAPNRLLKKLHGSLKKWGCDSSEKHA